MNPVVKSTSSPRPSPPLAAEGARRAGGEVRVLIQTQARKEALREPALTRPAATLSHPMGEGRGEGPSGFTGHAQFILEQAALDEPAGAATTAGGATVNPERRGSTGTPAQRRPRRAVSTRWLGLVFSLVAWVGSARGGGGNLAWHQEGGCRWAELPMPETGRTGFSLLPPEVTGIFFTNRLSDAAAANNRILENGSGVALGDVDGDGLCDIYFCCLEGRNRLYRNLGGWKFEDITDSAGVACAGQFSTGAVLADVDGDGDLDLLVNALGGGTRLFLNDGRGHFTEATQAGLVREYGATSMALADVDGDGTLDLYVATYRTTTYKDRPPGLKVEARMVDGRMEVAPADRFFPLFRKGGSLMVGERGEPDFLYLNDGKGHFAPVSWTDGRFRDEDGQPLKASPLEWGLSVMFRDLNGDGAPDLYVCNDFLNSRDQVWINDGSGHFRAIDRLALRNMSMSSMSVDFADINRDGYDDFFVADMLSRHHEFRQRHRPDVMKGDFIQPIQDPNFRPETVRNTLGLNRGDGTYAEIAQLSGVSASEWSWSAIFLDVDLDGYEDLLIATGNDHDVLDSDVLGQIAAAPDRSAGWRLNNLQKFPPLNTACLAFRNRGDLTFAETGAAWGFNTEGVSQGMALADLDNDGDLDVVINNLNRPAGIYRNNSIAPRVAVRLKGKAPNTRGIGAKIELFGGAVPRQSQEMICGGRYLAGDDAMRVFAAGAVTNRMRIVVTWRRGGRSVVEDVRANRVYEVDEAAAQPNRPAPQPRRPPLFEDVSGRIDHTHHEEPFDEFARQSALPRRLGVSGPGVAWHDVDGDGWDDLIVGGGKGGRLAAYRNDGHGGFTAQTGPPLDRVLTRDQTTVLGFGAFLFVGSSNYEDGSTNGGLVRVYDLERKIAGETFLHPTFSCGPLAMADLDGDGKLALFVGGRAIAGQYPAPAPALLMRNTGQRFVEAQRWEKMGLVSGAVWSDLDGDGYPELILACDWGPIRIFHNDHGRLIPWDPPVVVAPSSEADHVSTSNAQRLTLNQLTGWWNGVTTGDFDGDGRMDIVASNWGRNTKYQGFLAEPLDLYYGDFSGRGQVEVMDAYVDPGLGKVVPWMDRDTLFGLLPSARDRFASYRAYSTASVADILGDKYPVATRLQVRTLDSMVFLNRGDHFEARALPVEAQFAPAFGVTVGDCDGDGREDIFLAQNFFGVDAETSRYDAGRGLWLQGDGHGGFRAMPGQESGVRVYGEQRGAALGDYDGDGRVDLVVTENGGATKLYHNVGAKPGLRVRLSGPPGNPTAVGAVMQLRFGERWGAAREVHAGSGYWSQDSAVQVLAVPEPPTQIRIRWPGGKTTVSDLSAAVREIEVNEAGQIKTLR